MNNKSSSNNAADHTPSTSLLPSTSSTSTIAIANSNNENNENNNNDEVNNSEEEEEEIIYRWRNEHQQNQQQQNQQADLPSSFFEFYNNNNSNNNNCPEMDFLEMDFVEDELAVVMATSETTVVTKTTTVTTRSSSSSSSSCGDEELNVPSSSSSSNRQVVVGLAATVTTATTTATPPAAAAVPNNNEVEEVEESELLSIPPPPPLPLSSQNNNNTAALIWTEEEATELSVRQLGVSACGATAVCNVFASLAIKDIPRSQILKKIKTRLRQEKADLPEYLQSRSVAGITAAELISAVEELSGGEVVGRFFKCESNVNEVMLMSWLGGVIRKGATPLATLNPQQRQRRKLHPLLINPEELPDAWHHQMIYGVSPSGVHLTNPVEIMSFSSILPQLTSPSILLIRRQDVVSRFGPRTDLKTISLRNGLWGELNVLGQISNMLLEETPIFNNLQIARRSRSTHISIPASYDAGISLFTLKKNNLDFNQFDNGDGFYLS